MWQIMRHLRAKTCNKSGILKEKINKIGTATYCKTICYDARPGLDFLRTLRMLRRSGMLVLPNALKRLRRFRHFYFFAYESKLSPLKNKNASQTSFERHCARDWIRTSTSLRTLRPEHSASTNFATRACGLQI